MALPNPPYIGNQIPNGPFSSAPVPATFDRLFGTLVPNIQLEPNPSTLGGNGWVRPADWLEMPNVSETEEKFAGLFAVYDTPENFIAVYFEGDYTVDWGDGSIENFDSGGKAQHSYHWDSIPSSSLTSNGYKQVIVTVVPQAGSNLTVMDLSVRHNNIKDKCTQPFLDVIVAMPNASSNGFSMNFSGFNYGAYESNLDVVERIQVLNSGGKEDFEACFYSLFSLRSITILNSPNANNFRGILDKCYSLTEVVFADTSSVTNFSFAFQDCSSLKIVPLFDTSSAVDLSAMFQFCYSLASVPLFDTSNAESMSGMFGLCHSLTEIPPFDTSKVEDMSYFFEECYSLATIPLLDTSKVTDMAGMFYYCRNLQVIPELNSTSASNLGSIFDSCPMLQTAVLGGAVVNVSYANCLLNRQAIVDIFEGLGTVSSATIIVQGNYGAAELTPSDLAIATDKGWTVLS